MATVTGSVFIIHPVQNQFMNELSVIPLYRANNRKSFHESSTLHYYPAEESEKSNCEDYLIDQQQMKTIIDISKITIISDTQKRFQEAYPYLNLQFYKKPIGKAQPSNVKRFFPVNQPFGKVTALKKEGEITIVNTMTISELVEAFKNTYGLYVQVLRKSANLWLEITLTKDWTLEQQNNHGREISIQ